MPDYGSFEVLQGVQCCFFAVSLSVFVNLNLVKVICDLVHDVKTYANC